MKLISLSLLIVATFLLNACGSGGNESNGLAQGATVAVKAEVKTGTATIFYANYSSVTKPKPTASFTLTSKINPNTSTLQASDVSIQSEEISFELSSRPPSSSYNQTLAPITYTSKIIVPKGSSADWENVPIWSPTNAAFTGLTAGQTATFKVRVKFNGVESNGTSVKPETSMTLILER